MKTFRNFLLKKIISTGIGGPARFFVKAKNEKELAEAINWAKTRKLKWLVVGDGTNIIPDDVGFDGLIIQNKIENFKINGRLVNVGAGCNLFLTIKRFNNAGLAGMEKMAGIPGTVGGAIYGCAGAYGQEIKDHLIRVKIINVWKSNFQTSFQTSGRGKWQWLTNEQCQFGYRDSVFKRHPEWIIVGAEFKLIKGDPIDIKKTSAEIVKTRSLKYPPDLRCPGSFFKNIVVNQIKPTSFRKKILAQIKPGSVRDNISKGVNKLPAAYFLEQIGAKGMKRGGIRVAEYHANLVYNDGDGRTDDIKKLTSLLKNRVKKKFGIELEEEIRYL